MNQTMTPSTPAAEQSRGDSQRRTKTYSPLFDIVETDDGLMLLGDMPGVKPEDLEVHFKDGQLTLHGRVAPRAADGDWLHCEYGVGDFHRQFLIGEQIDTGRIDAALKNGVLTVHLPKSEKVKPRRIEVRIAE